MHCTPFAVRIKVNCSQFLDGYSEFRDGLLDEPLRLAFVAHITACTSCARYDHVVCRGVTLFREIPPVQPSSDFMPRLQHRIFHLEEERGGAGRSSSGASAGITFGIAALLAFAAWAPAVRPDSAPVQLPAIAAHAPSPQPQAQEVPYVFRTGPLLAEGYPTAARWNPPAQPVAQNLLFRYSPLGTASVQTAYGSEPR